MDEKVNEPKGRALTEQEQKEFTNGMDLFAITKMPGWKIIYEIWSRISGNVGPDPRGMKQEDYTFACLASWAVANNAKEFLETVQGMIDRATALEKIQSGEIKNRNVRL